MAGGRYGDALAAYAAEARPGGPRSPFEAGADGVTSGDALLTRSQELEDAAAAGLASGAAEVRELSTVQLAGGAALDLAAAADLLDAASGSPFEAGAGGSTVEQTYAELREVLDADPALGARDALPASAAAAVDAAFEAGATVAGADGLRNAATGAIDAIVDDAGKVVGYGVKGLGSLSLDAVIGAFGESADRLLSPIVARARGLIKLAMKHVVKAVSKLLRLLGPLEEPARACRPAPSTTRPRPCAAARPRPGSP
jgi:hypothetical protein